MGETIQNQTKSKYIPPGTVLVKDSMFIDKLEISNKVWKEFMKFNINSTLRDSVEYIDLMPDTSISIRIKNIGKIKMSEYFDDPRFDNYPIVGIKYDQAIKFCEWRTSKVNLLNIKYKKAEDITVEYRLPTLLEWDFAARANLDSTLYPFGIDVYYSILVDTLPCNTYFLSSGRMKLTPFSHP